jgi:cytochrome c oxidase subunit 4
MYYGYLNIASIVLGLITLVLIMVAFNEDKSYKRHLIQLLSFVTMILSVYFQIIYTLHLIEINDFSALMDIFPTLTTVIGIFITVMFIAHLMIEVRHQLRRKSYDS